MGTTGVNIFTGLSLIQLRPCAREASKKPFLINFLVTLQHKTLIRTGVISLQSAKSHNAPKALPWYMALNRKALPLAYMKKAVHLFNYFLSPMHKPVQLLPPHTCTLMHFYCFLVYNAGQKKRNCDVWIFCELPGRSKLIPLIQGGHEKFFIQSWVSFDQHCTHLIQGAQCIYQIILVYALGTCTPKMPVVRIGYRKYLNRCMPFMV